MPFLKKLGAVLGAFWTLAFMLGGATIGAVHGYATGGWIGAACLAFAGDVIGYFASRLVF